MDMLDGETEVRDYNLERLMMLSDGVFAIAMTLLALDLKPPANWDGRLTSLLDAMIPKLVIYGFSVFMIGVYWIRHRRTFGRIMRADTVLTIFNLVVLALVTLVPPSASLVWDFHLAKTGETGLRSGTTILLCLLAVIGLASGLEWIYAAFIANLVSPKISQSARVADSARQLAPPLIMAALTITQLPMIDVSVATPLAIILVGVVFLIRRWARGLERQAGA